MAQFALLNRRQAWCMEDRSLSVSQLLFVKRTASRVLLHHKWRILLHWLIHDHWVFRIVIVGLLPKQRLLFYQLSILFNGFFRVFFGLFLCFMQELAYLLPREKCAFCHPQELQPQCTYLASFILLMGGLRRLYHRILIYASLAGVC